MVLVSPLSSPLARPMERLLPTRRHSDAGDLSFVLTAGAMFAEVGYVSGLYGAISREPIGEEAPLWGLRNNLINTTMLLAFSSWDEEVLAVLEGLALYVDGEPYPGSWSIGEGGIGYTLDSPNEIPPLEDGLDHQIEFR